MPLELVNTTPYTCDRYALTARNGATFLRIVLKGAFDIDRTGRVALSDVQPPIVLADEYWREPATSSVKYESELILGKPGADLVVHGEACAPGDRPVTKMMIGLAYEGRWLKRLQVAGDREWVRGVVGWMPSAAQYFKRIPVVYDRAFGGSDEVGSEPRNRIGVGYASRLDAVEGMPLPNIEWPDQLLDSPSKRPTPAGLGVVSRNWLPRMQYAGTYDEQWLEHDFPLLPADFDERYFHSVASDQWIAPPRGGEEVLLDGMSPEGQIHFALPSCDVPVQLCYDGSRLDGAMRPETVLVDAVKRTCTITWSADADIHGDPFRLKKIFVGPPPNGRPCGCDR
jgi:hypothetical protein